MCRCAKFIDDSLSMFDVSVGKVSEWVENICSIALDAF